MDEKINKVYNLLFELIKLDRGRKLGVDFGGSISVYYWKNGIGKTPFKESKSFYIHLEHDWSIDNGLINIKELKEKMTNND